MEIKLIHQGIGYPVFGVTGSCEVSTWMLGTKLSSIEEQPGFVTTKPPLLLQQEASLNSVFLCLDFLFKFSQDLSEF